MNLNSRITLAILNFFKKHGVVLLFVFFIWLILVIINQTLKANPEQKANTSSYNPDNPVIDDNGDVPEQYREAVKELIDDFFKLCQSKQYDQAFNLLTDDCKSYIYNNSVNTFSQYAKSKFLANKTYYIQNYSNIDNTYIYDFYIIEDLETTGGTGGYNEYKEKIAIVKQGNTFRLSNQGYIGRKQLDIKSADDNLNIKVNYKDITYQREAYNVTFTNRTGKYILISDGSYTDAVTLNLGTQKRNATNTPNATFLIEPNTTKTFNFIFDKFVDDHKTPTEINFNDIAIFTNYNTNMTIEQTEKLYSLNIILN